MLANISPRAVAAKYRRITAPPSSLYRRLVMPVACLALAMWALSDFSGAALSAQATGETAQMAKAAGGGVVYSLASIPFFVRDVLVLRTLAIVVGSIAIGYNFFGLPEPNWILVASMSVVVIVNAVRIAHLLWEKRDVTFTKDEQELFETLFRAFSPVEFMKLMRVGAWQTAQAGRILAREGENLDELLLIGHGEVVIERGGEEIARANDGAIIGEMSFLQGGTASATVRTNAPTSYVVWPADSLRKLLRRNPTIDVAMRSVLSMDLIHKLGSPE